MKLKTTKFSSEGLGGNSCNHLCSTIDSTGRGRAGNANIIILLQQSKLSHYSS